MLRARRVPQLSVMVRLRRLVMAVLPALVACNSIVGFGDLRKVSPIEEDDDEDDSTTPGRSDTGRTDSGGGKTDGPAPGAKCDLSKPFDPPVALAGPINSASFEVAPSLMKNELAIVFQRTVGPEGGSMMLATRTSVDVPFGEPVELTALAQGLDAIQQPTMTSDGLLLFFIGLRGPDAAIYTASRASPAGEFTNRRRADELRWSGNVSFPALTPNGAELWFSVDPGVGDPRHFFRSLRDNLGSYSVSSPVNELTSPLSEAGIAFSEDGLTIYFGSERAGGQGLSDVWTASRPSMGAPFGPATVVQELNAPGDDYPGWLSADGCRLYFGSDRSGDGDIFVATRTP